MKFFTFKKGIYPFLALLFSITFLVFGLIMAKNEYAIYFYILCYFTLMIFGSFKSCIKLLLPFLFISLIFSTLTYFIYDKNFASALTMFNRFFSLFLVCIIGNSVSSIRISRCLSSLHFPKSITLGMMISTSFIVVLKDEISRILKAMKTRGAGNVLNPKVFYRALLIPFIIRIVNISDTLSLSIETRGFTLNKSNTTIYKKEIITISDVLFSLLIIFYMVGLIIL